jgi:hypothetical protein
MIRQVCTEEMNESEPLMRRRYPLITVKTKLLEVVWDKL